MATKDAFRDPKMKIYGPPVSQGDKAPSLGIGIFKSNVSLNVYTNTERDPDTKQWIDARMSYFVLGQLFEVLLGYAGVGSLAGKLPNGIVIENYNKPKDGDGNPGNKQLVSHTEVGIDEKDELYISIISSDQARPMIRFKFYDDYWHVFKDRDTGEPLSGARKSRLAAIATVNAWAALIPVSVREEFEAGSDAASGVESGQQKPAWNNNGGNKQWNNNGNKQWGNKGGGGNWNKGNGGGNWNKGGGNNNWKQNNYQNKGNYQNNNGGGGGNWNNNNNQGGNGGGNPNDDVPF